MTTQEFSNEFDVLYNNVMSNQAPGLDEYEKSVFLTKAQTQIVLNYFNRMKNSLLSGMDDSEERQYDFSSLLRTQTLHNITESANNLKNITSTFAIIYNRFLPNQFDIRSTLFCAPSDYLLSINEQIVDSNNMLYSIIPIDYHTYTTLVSKPYGLPLKRQAWRLICDKTQTWNHIYTQQYSYQITTNIFTGNVLIDNSSKYQIKLNLYIGLNSSDTNYSLYYNKSVEIQNNTLYINYFILSSDTTKMITLSDDDDIDTSAIDEDILDDVETALSQITITRVDTSSKATTSAYSAAVISCIVSPAIYENGHIIEAPVYEVIGKYTGDITYKMRYIRKPNPIVLVSLDTINEGLSIDGFNQETNCELPSALHQSILQRAVELAKATYIGDLQTMIALGGVSQTDIGIPQVPKQQDRQ